MMKHDLIGVRGSAFGVALAFATISTSVLAADLGAIAPAAYTKAPAYELVRNWTGLYIGGNVGYGWQHGGTDLNELPRPGNLGITVTNIDPKAKGVIGGGQIGYNWQIGSIVTGLEADLQGSGIKGNAAIATTDDIGAPVALSTDHKLSWFGTVRGRLGFTVSPSVLLYGTGGLAYGDVEANSNAIFNGVDSFPANVSITKTGWAAGAGAEWMFTQNWSAKVEYLRVDLGKASATSPLRVGGVGANYQSHAQYDTVRFGVNYHFN
jgi:outer membrane immunogenic protein